MRMVEIATTEKISLNRPRKNEDSKKSTRRAGQLSTISNHWLRADAAKKPEEI